MRSVAVTTLQIVEPILSEPDRTEVKRMLDEALSGDVNVDLYTRRSSLIVPGQEQSETGPIAEQLLTELAALNAHVKLTVHDAGVEPDAARNAGVEGLDPVLVFSGEGVKGKLRYLGLPNGHEFRTLLETLIAVSRKDSGLSEPSKAALAKVEKPVHLQVFVTPG